MGEIMKEYFKNYWKWMCLALVFPILLTLLTFFMDNTPLGNVEVYTILFICVLIFISFIWLIVGLIRKSIRLPVTILLISCLSLLFIYGYSRVLGPRNYTESDTGMTVNGFQRHRLNSGIKKIKQIDHALNNNDNHSESSKAKKNSEYLNNYIMKHSNSNSARTLSKYSYKELNRDLGKTGLYSNDVGPSNALRNLILCYGQTVLSQHNTDKELIDDQGRSLRQFVKELNI